MAPDTSHPLADNQAIADILREAATMLEAQGANPFRVAAYRHAADAVVALDRPLREIFEADGLDGLVALPHIGRGIGAAIAEILITGRWSGLERLRGSLDPVQLFRAVPGIGPGLAARIHDTLHLDTLEGLEVAAHDGRLEQVPGVGPRRAATVRSALAGMLRRARVARTAARTTGEGAPPVALLLEVDAEYREKAGAGGLPTIAPRRFNPSGEAWLAVLHVRRGDWHFTALYSNTARAHELGRTRDWVVIYFYDDQHAEGQHTVVTESRGPLAGMRVVRGREDECRAHYRGT